MTKILTGSKFDSAFSYYMIEVLSNAKNTYKNSPSANVDVTFSEGGRYNKVIISTWGSRSVHSFVDRISGDILKASSWTAPAKHARGNIFDADSGRSALSAYGVKYLR